MRLLACFLLVVSLAAQAPDAPKPADQSASSAQAAPAAQSSQAAPAAQSAASAPAAAPAPAAENQPSGDNWLTGSIELGYRWVPTPGGTDNAYRSVVNLTDGFRILNSDFTILDPHHWLFDRADVHTSNWGDPYTTLRVNIEKHDWYNLTANYRNIAYFDFLPSFANPEFNQGALLDQNSFDTAIRATDIQLDLLPHKWITPYLGFSSNTQYGRGVTDFNQESQYNEYPVASLYSDLTNNYRAGVRMEMGKYHVTLEQGGTTFKDDQGASDMGPNPGNFTGLLFGETMPLDSMDELYRVRGDSVYSKALLAANPLPWISVTGQFVYARPRTDVDYTENSTGNFLLQRILQFYSSGQDLLTGDANMPHLTGSLSVELRPWRRFRIVESWMSDRFHGASDALLVENLLAGMPLTDQQLANERIVLRYNQEEVDAYYEVTPYLTLRGGYRFVWGNTDVTAPILTGLPSETANLHRNVGIAGVSYRLGQKFRINGDAEGSNSAQAFFRTSLQQYEKAHVRAQYDLSPAWHVAADVSLLNNSNPNPNVQLDFSSRVESASLNWTPNSGKWGSVLVDYSRVAIRSDILYLIPQSLQPTPSIYTENDHLLTTLASFRWFAVGGSMFLGSGSRPTQYYQPLARLTVPLHKHVDWITEWRWYAMNDVFYALDNFRSNQIMSSLRFSR
ncbi:MAG TPA: hypothetical protein VMB25_25180 [Bryobacteraceae bacterium]|nr:hypothetical protein [Bryobacteraceae bacterium]